MLYTKFTTGHTDTTAIRKHLEKDSRPLATDHVNLDAIVADVQDRLESYAQLDWAHEMDAPRHGFGNDKPWRGNLTTAFAMSMRPLAAARSLP